MGCEHYGDVYTAIGPEELTAECERLLAWLPTRQVELQLHDEELERFAALLRAALPADPATQEPSLALRELLHQREQVEERAPKFAAMNAPEVIVRNMWGVPRRCVKGFLGLREAWRDGAEAWDPADPLPLFVPRVAKWASTLGGARFRAWSFWTPWEWEQAGLPALQLPDDDDDDELDDGSETRIDLGEALLARLDQPGWTDLRAQHLAVLDEVAQDSRSRAYTNTDEVRAFRDKMRAEYEFTPGMFEGNVILGRLTALLGPLNAEALFPTIDHVDFEYNYSVHLEVEASSGARARVWADEDNHVGDGLPWIRIEEGPMALLQDVVDTLLSDPLLGDCELPGHARLAIEGGGLVRRPAEE